MIRSALVLFAAAWLAVGVSAQGAATDAPPRVRQDHTTIFASVQAGDGVVWAVGQNPHRRLYVWRGEGWVEHEETVEWPGSVLTMMASPSQPDVVYSVWSGPQGSGGVLTTLHVWRHEAGQPSRMLASFANPSAVGEHNRGEIPQVSIDETDTIWLALRGDRLLRLPPGGGEPQALPFDEGVFPPLPADKARHGRPQSYLPESPARGWLWTVQNDVKESWAHELPRPVLVENGRVRSLRVPQGLPANGLVTWMTALENGRLVWALEGEGLWEVDPAEGTARSLSSPPGVWRITDRRVFPDGLEIVLGCAERSGTDRLSGDVWVRRDDTWINAGPSGDTRGGLTKSRRWLWWDGQLLATGFRDGLLHVDFSSGRPVARALGWREHLNVGEPRFMHVLPDGRLLVIGSGTQVIEPGALPRLWAAAADAPTVWTVKGNPVRADDGRLWSLVPQGRGGAVVRHWDGRAWSDWPLPAEMTQHWSEELLWVDARGRVAVFSWKLDDPAWEREESVEGGWRRWESGQALVAARAAENPPVDSLSPVRQEQLRRPVIGPGGRALMFRGSFWQLADGVWTARTPRELGRWPIRYGFEEDGVAWLQASNRKFVQTADGGWSEAGALPHGTSLMSHANDSWPDWLRERLDRNAVRAVHRDEEDVWWILHKNELWRGHAGEVLRVFAEDEPSPFRMPSVFYGVLISPDGTRLFHSERNVLLPAGPGPELTVRVIDGDQPVDKGIEVAEDSRLLRHEWRLAGGEWRRGEPGVLWLREVTDGGLVVELRGVNRRLEIGPVTRVELRSPHSAADRARVLIARLRSEDYAGRADATRRLSALGVAAKTELEAALENESDASRRWWLRAALQAVTDGHQFYSRSP